jgi:Predicted integral membrane protein (DUF2269)
METYAAGVGSGIYNVFLLLHILAAIIGFGGILLNGFYGIEAGKRPGPAGRAVSEANLKVSQIAMYFIYAVPVFGFALSGTSDDTFKMSQTWLWLAFVLWLAIVGVCHAILFKGHKRINVLLAEIETAPRPAGGRPPQAVEIQAIGKQLASVSVAIDVAVIVVLYLMVWRPGS